MNTLPVGPSHLASLPTTLSSVGSAAAPTSQNAFLDLLEQSIQEVNSLQTTAEDSIHDLLTGKDVNSAEVLTSVQKADMAFRLMQQIRNKLVDAYREINQMQI